jgi:hypothetical protein
MKLNSANTKISNRTLNIPSRNNINTVDQLLAFANSKLFQSKRLRRLGRQSSYEIIKFVQELEGKESNKTQKFESLIRTTDLAELEHLLKKNVEKYGVETVANLFKRYISLKNSSTDD